MKSLVPCLTYLQECQRLNLKITERYSVNSTQKLIILYIGNGKGKTTAALGLASRCLGQGGKVCICQFIKSNLETGEYKFFNNLEQSEICALGLGFVHDASSEDELREHEKMARIGLQLMAEKLFTGLYDLIIADEILDVIGLGFISVAEVEQILRSSMRRSHIVLTGRKAPQSLIDMADTVTEMVEIKHHYRNGVKALKGIEY